MIYISTHWKQALALFGGLMCAAGAAYAQSPHFLDSKTVASISADGDLSVKFKEAGLGDTTTEYHFTANADATCTCVTNSGKCPKAANKVTFSSQQSVDQRIDPKNGTVSATLTITAPGCPSSAPPTCGGGQTLQLSAIAYSFIKLTDVTNNIVATGLPPSLGTVLFNCP